jgi:hypothetical protein
VAEERKETGDCNRLVAVPNHLEIYRMDVIFIGQKGHDRVDGHHEQNADDARIIQRLSQEGERHSLLLFIRFKVVCSMPKDQEQRQDRRKETKCGGEDQTELMKRKVVP